ncbi:hypothetical protein SAMN05421847_2758 [Halpernia humi]|uniref:DUF4348 domain-containing protein n=1 Tax=Halpernia humi TaxID=493375 RepID=A0A1H6B897_9FLAO|nr:hypothetical protein [Halpernia humi]SEG56346.1 hypothetical protein SAMN05421847_2758 [Halpernia humi]
MNIDKDEIKMKYIVLILLLGICWNCKDSTKNTSQKNQIQNSVENLSEKDYEVILQKILNLKNINQYFHKREFYIYSENKNINSKLNLKYRNKKIIILNQKNLLSVNQRDIFEITKIELKGNVVKVSLHYSFQGMSSEISLTKVNNMWEIIDEHTYET